MSLRMRGIRGATTAEENSSEAILAATKILLNKIIDSNSIDLDEVCSIFFSVTPDLNADFPAKAARQIGLTSTPLMCMKEIPVPGDLGRGIRVLININYNKKQVEMKNIYLNEAARLRPDISGKTK